MARQTVHYVRGRAMSALAYPTRLDIIEALTAEQPATVETLAHHLDRDPRALYAHLRPLVEAGLVVEAGSRPTSKRPAKLYRLPADSLEFDPEDHSKRAREARRKVANVVFRRARALHERELDHPDVEFAGPDCSLVLGYRVARLSPQGRRRLDAKLLELWNLIGQEHDERGELFAFTLHMAPAARSTRSSKPAPRRGSPRRSTRSGRRKT